MRAWGGALQLEKYNVRRRKGISNNCHLEVRNQQAANCFKKKHITTRTHPHPTIHITGGPAWGGLGPRPRPQMWGQGARTASRGAQIGPGSAQTAVQAATDGPPLTQEDLQGVSDGPREPQDTSRDAQDSHKGPEETLQHASSKPTTFRNQQKIY